MKNLLILSVIYLTPLAASANNLYCNPAEQRQPGDSGRYATIISGDSKSARLWIPTRGVIPDTIELSCQTLPFAHPGRENTPHVSISCVDLAADQPSYMVTVITGGIVGISANVLHDTGHGFQSVSSLICQNRAE